MAIGTDGSVFVPGRVLQSRYRLDEALAVGGMAEVWRGHDLVLQRQVAIKLLHPHLASDPALVERFRREAVTAARLSHPHIVPTYDAGADEGAAYIVLGLVHGPTLADEMKKGKIAPRKAVAIARQVADALEHAHQGGLIHRDIKPANVLIVDGDQRVMVADFGIAKAVADSSEASLTVPGLIVGTPAYLAPEQAAGNDADARSDVYATGVLLHEMVCGHTSVDQPTQWVAEPGQPAASTRCDQLPESLRDVVEKATDPDPNRRFQSAAELCFELAALERALTQPKPAAKGPMRMAISPPPPPRSRIDHGPRDHALRDAGPAPLDTQQHDAIPVATGDPHRFDAPTVSPGQVDLALGRPVHAIPPNPSAKRRNIVLMAIVLVLLIATIGVARYVATESGKASPSRATAPAALTLSNAHSFDPLGDKTENESSAQNAIDGNPSTAWSTEGYSNRNFGGLKAGVGLVLQTSSSAQLSKLVVSANGANWSAAIYVAGGPKDTLGEWGSPVDQQTGLGTTATFDLKNTSGAAILIWITDLGDANKVAISEATLTN